MRDWYQRKSPAERRALVLRRDPEVVRENDRKRYQRDKTKRNLLVRAAVSRNPATSGHWSSSGSARSITRPLMWRGVMKRYHGLSLMVERRRVAWLPDLSQVVPVPEEPHCICCHEMRAA
jgi:hypothetical protein